MGGDVTTSPPPSSGPSRINPKKRPQQNTPKSSIVANWAPKTIPKLNQHGVMFSISRILWFLQPLSIDITEIYGLREFFFALFHSCFSRSSPDSFALCFASIFHIFEIPFSAQWDPQIRPNSDKTPAWGNKESKNDPEALTNTKSRPRGLGNYRKTTQQRA